MTIETQMKSLFSDVLDIGEEHLDADIDLADLQLDTLDKRELTSGIRSQFCIDFDEDDLEYLDTFGELVKRVTHKAGN